MSNYFPTMAVALILLTLQMRSSDAQTLTEIRHITPVNGAWAGYINPFNRYVFQGDSGLFDAPFTYNLNLTNRIYAGEIEIRSGTGSLGYSNATVVRLDLGSRTDHFISNSLYIATNPLTTQGGAGELAISNGLLQVWNTTYVGFGPEQSFSNRKLTVSTGATLRSTHVIVGNDAFSNANTTGYLHVTNAGVVQFENSLIVRPKALLHLSGGIVQGNLGSGTVTGTVELQGSFLGSGTLNANLLATGNASLTAAVGGLAVGNSGSVSGVRFQGTSFTVDAHTVTLNDLDFAELNTAVSLAGGTLQSPNGIHLSGGRLTGTGFVLSTFSGSTASTITASGGALELGNASALNGFSHAGTLDVGNNTVSLASRGFASLGVLTTLTGGTINAANGVSLGVGSNLSGNGTVSGKVAAGFGSTIEANGGNLSLGTASSLVGFASDGELYTGVNNVTLHDSNQAVLGSYTLVGSGGNSGTLTAANGILIEQGKNLEGQGLISSTNTLAKAVYMNGYTNGTGTGLVFNGYIKGTGIFDGTVSFTGTLAPGLSPTSSTLNNMILGSTSTLEMELGGTQLGSQYDHLNFMGMGSLNGTLDVVLINGFQPSLGNTFNLFDGSTSGSFSSLNLPELIPGLTWDTSQLYTAGSLSVIAIPEPGTFTLIGGCIIGMTMLYRKRG